jgi:hypothetical protein
VSGHFSLYIMLSWNGKEVVGSGYYFFMKIIHANDNYCCVECYRAREEFFGTLAQVP